MNKSGLSLIEKSIQKKIEKYFSDCSSFFIIGVSGGIDSMASLYAFHKLRIPVLVSHINYKKRGEASDKDAELVEQMAFEWGFECQTTMVDSADAAGQNFQQWARELRYNIFRELRKEYNASGIVVGHNEDDQIETVLHKILRGAGFESWAGMEEWNGEIFRPLLDVSRGDIERYVENKAIPYRTDESNLRSAFARNFLRNEWRPEMNEFFPGWKQNLLRVSKQAETHGQALEWIARNIKDKQGLDRKAFHSLDQSLQKALILHLLKQEEPAIRISHYSLDQLHKLSDLQTGKELQLTNTFSIVRDRKWYVIKKQPEEGNLKTKVSFEELKASPLELRDIVFSIESYDKPDFGKALYIDADKISWPLTLRNWQHGDLFQPFGMEGHQKISDHLTNRKVSSAHKNQVLVVESFEETICAVIFPPTKNKVQPGTIADNFKCSADTKFCLKITYRN